MTFITNYYGGFTLLYGVVLSFVITKSWEQFDVVNRLFNLEVETVNNIYNELFFLRGKNRMVIEEIAASLQKYVVHVLENYYVELDDQEQDRIGNHILDEVMENFKALFRTSGMRTKEEEIIIPNLIYKLNDLKSIRGDRVHLASHRPFSSLRIVALITSIIFLLPLYFIGFTAQSGFLENFIITWVVLLAILIYLIVEDLDDPFEGAWKINDKTWHRLCLDMDSPRRKLELENLDSPTRKAMWRSRNTDKIKRKKLPDSKLEVQTNPKERKKKAS